MKQKAKKKQSGITKPKADSKNTESWSKTVKFIKKKREKAYTHDIKKVKWDMDVKTHLNII